MAVHELPYSAPPAILVDLPDEAASVRFGVGLAMLLQPGDLILLEGDLGSGKTTLARALLRAVAGDASLEVPSPTFTLVQAYDLPGLTIAHMDFYRIEDAGEVDELGLDDALAQGAVIVEWPQRAPGALPEGGLHIALTEKGAGRIARLTSSDTGWRDRLHRLLAIDDLLGRSGWAGATRSRMPGDASSRRYERLHDGPCGAGALLMDMPARPDGPPVRNGKPYSRIANLAEDIRAVEAVNKGLRAHGLSAPDVLAIDHASGLALVEDFGRCSFNSLIRAGEDIREPVLAAVCLLADMAGRNWPATVSLANGESYTVPPYDRDALMIEAELCLDWYWPYLTGTTPSANAREDFVEAWDAVLPLAQSDHPIWVLRDFHVDNLFWLPQRDGIARVGLIDTQDCVMGHPAYDLASLLLDVRVKLPDDLVGQSLAAYRHQRAALDNTFDPAAFDRAYAVLGAQRATKILGIFARLARRDGKPVYLGYLPRTSDVLEHSLAHPVMACVRHWFETHLPASVRTRGPR
jgi:N-acetylmuramate 1-kinase